MFLGEFSCLGVFYLLVWRDRRRPEPSTALAQPFNPLLFLPPALCDMTGTSIMYVGKCWGCGDVSSVPSWLSLRLWDSTVRSVLGEDTEGVWANASHPCNELWQDSVSCVL